MPSERQALNVAVIPSVSGGLGHISRTLKLARALHDADPSLHICYVLSERFLRPFNVDVVRGTGFPVRMLPDPTRQERDQIVNEVLGDIDVVIEDTERRLIAYRPLLPRLRAWISVPMLPLWDELFMDWPLLDHADHILYTLPPELPVAEEIARFRDKMTVTGPILDEHAFPERRAARRRLGLADGDTLITYAPRGFPFGPDFGMTVLDAVVGAFIELRRARPGARLMLTAVPDLAAVQPPELPPLDQIAGVQVAGVLPPDGIQDIIAGADLAVLEGYSALMDAAVARTPVLMIPGTIYECWAEGDYLAEHDAGVVVWIEAVTRTRIAAAMRDALDPARSAARAERLSAFVGTGGRERAVAAILKVIAERIPQ